MDERKWIKHFEKNRENRPEPDWEAPVTVTAEMLQPIRSSLEQFLLSGLAAGTMLWLNHAPCLKAIGGTRGAFYAGITRQITRFVGSLKPASTTPRVRSAWAGRARFGMAVDSDS